MSDMSLFDKDEFNSYNEHWKEMPEYNHENKNSYKSIIVHFRDASDYVKFSKLMDQRMSPKTKAIWYPKMDFKIKSDFRYFDEGESDETTKHRKDGK